MALCWRKKSSDELGSDPAYFVLLGNKKGRQRQVKHQEEDQMRDNINGLKLIPFTLVTFH